MRRGPAELGLELPRVPVQRLPSLVHVRRHPERPRLPGDRSLDSLADPPGRVGRELEALSTVELLDRAVKPDHAVLDQIAVRNAVPAVALRDVDDQAEVGVDHPLLGSSVAALDALRERDLFRRRQQRVAADLVQEQLERVRRGGQSLGLERAVVGCLDLLFGGLEQGLDFRVLQGGADGYSFHSSGWTERLLRRGGEAQNRRSRPLNRTTAGAWAFPLRHSSCGPEIGLYATFATSSRLADNWGVASARKAVAKAGR